MMRHLARSVPLAAVVRSIVGAGQVVRIDDDFSVGPTPQPGDSVELWCARRALYWHRPPDWVGFDEDVAFSSGAMTLWLGQSPADRLPAAWWCAEALRRGAAHEVWVVDIAAPSLGSLPEAWLATLLPGQPIDRAYVEALADLWRAWCAPEPAALVALSHGEPDDPQTQAATRLLDRYPDQATGLGSHDRRLLTHARDHGASLARVIGQLLGDNWDLKDCVGDRWLFARAQALADPRLPRPLLALVPRDDEGRMSSFSAELTPDGLAVLEGRAHAVTLNGPGFLEPIGGVRFDVPGGPVWLRTPDGVTPA